MSVYGHVDVHAWTIESMNVESYMTPNSGVGMIIRSHWYKNNDSRKFTICKAFSCYYSILIIQTSNLTWKDW